jgi:ferrous iron transport protein A
MNSVFGIPLDMVHPGVWADVVDVYGDASWIGRLAEIGIRSGSRLRVVNHGRPCIIEVGATRFSFRGDDVSQILVRPIESAQ